jgi:hypothetical protein
MGLGEGVPGNDIETKSMNFSWHMLNGSMVNKMTNKEPYHVMMLVKKTQSVNGDRR